MTLENSSAVPASGSNTTAAQPATPNVLDRFLRWLYYIGGVILFVFVLFMMTDVFLRYLFDRPLPYSIDISIIVLVVTGFFGIAYVQVQKAHLSIDILTGKWSISTRQALTIAFNLICLVTTGLLVWQGVVNTVDYYVLHKLSYNGMPLYPSAAIVPLGFLFLFLVFLRDFVSDFIRGIKLHMGAVRWILALVFPIVFLAVMWVFTVPLIPGLNILLLGFVSILFVILFSFLGMPLAFTLIIMGIVLMGYTSGLAGAWMVASTFVYQNASNYNFIIIPLYVIMSVFITVTGIGTDSYKAAYRWVGHWRGGLAHASVIACAALGAVQGSPTTAIVTLGPVAIPEMRKMKYEPGLAVGVIAAGAMLGPIIPPSMSAVMFGILANASIGKLFIAGILPGILLTVLFILQIWIQTRISPNVAPAGPRSSWKERREVLPVLLPIGALFILIIGGIYAGIFTAMEGGGIGAFIALVIALVLRRLTWKNFNESLLDSMKFICMMFLVIVGGLVFGNALGASGMSQAMVDFLIGAGVSPLVFVVVTMFIYLIWGVFCDAPIIVILTIPVLAPIATKMGVDLIWFGTLTTIVVGLGACTPPYAMGLFILKAIAAQDVPLMVIYKGIIPYCVTTIICTAILIAFPGIILWLPSMMR